MIGVDILIGFSANLSPNTTSELHGSRYLSIGGLDTCAGNIVKSTNELILENYKGHLGGKTGTTDLGGLCFSGVYQYKGVKYVTVVLGSSSRWSDTKKLFHYIRKYG